MSQPTPEQLRSAIKAMDCRAQSAFTQIASMARLALLALEQPGTYAGTGADAIGVEDIANVLSAIQYKAGGAESDLNVMAASVGCDYLDDAPYRRWEALHQADESVKSKRGAA